MKNPSENIYDKFPEMKTHPIKMKEANQSILIHAGSFILNSKNKIMTLDGTISFDWLPKICVKFKGELVKNELDINFCFESKLPVILSIEGHDLGNCIFTGMKISGETTFEGQFWDEVIVGDKSIPVSSVRFVIPNLKPFHGEPYKLTSKDRIQSNWGRLIFSNQDYNITIDMLPDYDKLNDKLSSQGGYIIQYVGEVVKTKGLIYHDNIENVTQGFSLFLSFINGRRCSTLFNQGIHENQEVWIDYTPKKVDSLKSVFSWTLYENPTELNNLWNNFYKLWLDISDKSFLKSAIHWYLEANKNSTYVEGSIILTQIGLELIYNWYVIETKKLIMGKDSETISASNKIRLLLSQINLTSDTPQSLKRLNLYIKDNKLPDGIEAFVQIRNSLVHSQEDKREKFRLIDEDVLPEALGLGLWYLELSILKVLNYQGSYLSRCSSDPVTGTNILKVPWTIN